MVPSQAESKLPRPKASDSSPWTTIDGIFAHHAALYPQVIALEEGALRWTYQELNQRANQIARFLRAAGARHESLVGLCLERSALCIAGMLGILKAGAAYVPINPAYPQTRRSLMLSGVSLLLTTRALAAEYMDSAVRVICLDDKVIEEMAKENLPRFSGEESLAYVIYTSGSTGQPKGVAVEHRGVIRLFSDPNFLNLEQSDLVAQTLNVCFDASVLEIWGALLNGARLVILDSETILSPARFQHALKRYGITALMTTTAYFNLIARHSPSAFSRLRYVVFGGEAADPRAVSAVLKYGPPKHLFNAYGPTEASVVATCLDIREIPEGSGPIPIGHPLTNTAIYFLDSDLCPVPIGEPGELCIGGAAVARGYLDAPDLNAQRFIKNPFSSQPGARLYRSGDLARWLTDGTIELIGRLDAQLKIRGFRIEPGEIEAVLKEHPAIDDALVMARPNQSGENRLIAYAAGDTSRLKVEKLRTLLKSKLPGYMLPSAIVTLEKLPLNLNGKVDRQALPYPSVKRANPFIGPQNTLEAQLAAIWEGAMGIESIGVTDNFFELGGDSLVAAKLFAEIEKVLGQKLPLTTLFQAPTIEKLATTLIQEGWKPDWSPLVAVWPHGSRPPFFCVHGGFGGVLFYGQLARALSVEQPLYALQAEGLDGSPIGHPTIPSMAAHYLDEVRQVQSQGPYFLGGYSFGGVVAFEMAHQLRAAGEEVALLVLFDAADYNTPLRRYSLADRIDLDWQSRALRSQPEKLPHLLRRTANRLRAILGQRLQYALASLRLVKTRKGAPVSALDLVQRSNRHALSNYELRPYPGQVTLFRAEDPDDGYIHPIDNGWAKYAPGGLQIYKVPGQHQEIFSQPNVGVLAEKLEICLCTTGVNLCTSKQFA